MQKILIESEALDYHGRAVQWGLQIIGEHADWWQRSNFPSHAFLSIPMSEATGPSMVATDTAATFQPDQYKAIWNRRGRIPTINDKLNAADRVVAKAESRHVTDATCHLVERFNPNALKVNPVAAASEASLKVLQLALAHEAGFQIPNTLISNNPSDIRSFFNGLQGEMIAKQHIPFAWRNSHGGLAVPGTSKVSREQLNDDLSLSASPMIYQECLPIAQEIRITAFGNTSFAILQERDGVHNGAIRDIRWETPNSTAMTVPKALHERCKWLMKMSGLAFATFDIAITTSSKEVFLECNEAGQFLFLEERAAEIPVLDAFCKFLASADKDFEYDFGSRHVSLSDFNATDSAIDLLAEMTAQMRRSRIFSPFELRE